MAQSFKAAFAAARKSLGAGKTFTWNGKSYSTNIAGEGSSAPKSSAKPQARPAAVVKTSAPATSTKPKARPAAPAKTSAPASSVKPQARPAAKPAAKPATKPATKPTVLLRSGPSDTAIANKKAGKQRAADRVAAAQARGKANAAKMRGKK